MKKILMTLFSMTLLSTSSWALDSTSINSPNVSPSVTPKLIWYQPEIRLPTGRTQDFRMNKACPRNQGNVFCSFVRMPNNDKCAVTDFSIYSYINHADPRIFYVTPVVNKQSSIFCRQSTDPVTVACSVICKA